MKVEVDDNGIRAAVAAATNGASTCKGLVELLAPDATERIESNLNRHAKLMNLQIVVEFAIGGGAVQVDVS